MNDAESPLIVQKTMMEKYQDEDIEEDRRLETTLDHRHRHRSRYQWMIIIILLFLNVVQAILLLRAWPNQKTEGLEAAGMI